MSASLRCILVAESQPPSAGKLGNAHTYATYSTSKRNSRPFLLLALVSVLSAACSSVPETTAPNIDRLAREGMRFDRCLVTNSICAPACYT